MEVPHYRALIQQIIEKHAREYPEDSEILPHLVFDEQRERYLLINVGWRGEKRFHGFWILPLIKFA